MEQEWINSDEQRPLDLSTVMITYHNTVRLAAYYSGNFHLGADHSPVYGTVWWMPMPEPYHRGKHEKH